jgi:hypothetical protein
MPIIADRIMGLTKKFWRRRSKSAKTGKDAGVFACGKSEDVLRMSAEMRTAVFELKALPPTTGLGRPGAFYPKDKRLIIEGPIFFARPRPCDVSLGNSRHVRHRCD